MKRILIAPNAFKNSLDATAAAAAIRDGFLKSKLACSCTCFPIGDGGDGTAALIIQQLKGRHVQVKVTDPLGRPVNASFGLIDNDQTAVIEMADASGIRLLDRQELNPLTASSFGTGEMIKAALDKKVKKIVIGMGGSATVDGGTGILRSMGIVFLDEQQNELINLPLDLDRLHSIDTQHLDQRILNCEVIVLCDVSNTLLGEAGAAHVFGPQKGASREMVVQLDAGLAIFAECALAVTGKNIAGVLRGGTAGGAAAGLYAFINARLVNGIEYFLDITSFDTYLQHADLVITGEGSLDEQTLNGKGPFGVATRAKQKGLPVIGMAGKIPVIASSPLHDFFDELVTISNENLSLDDALKLTGKSLTLASLEIGNRMASALPG